ncbi:WXG100 family type VII secretion target [Actinophytocola sp.]|uniref:WXG100 family type VII secretion target n=1 Tax=Actinophytocola sp. TaxID=1872138 RepID=UPI002ED4BF1C
MSYGEENAQIVFGVVEQGHQYLAEAIRKVTGDPGELRAKADECARCATEVGDTASSTDKILANLGQTWQGKAYDSCNQVTTELTKELVEVLKRELEQEKQRLEQSAQALVSAKSQTEQQKQNFGQQAQQIIQQMQQAIQAAKALPDQPPHMKMIKIMLIAMAIMNAFGKATKAKNSAQQAADSTMKELSNTLTSLFSNNSTATAA